MAALPVHFYMVNILIFFTISFILTWIMSCFGNPSYSFVRCVHSPTIIVIFSRQIKFTDLLPKTLNIILVSDFISFLEPGTNQILISWRIKVYLLHHTAKKWFMKRLLPSSIPWDKLTPVFTPKWWNDWADRELYITLAKNNSMLSSFCQVIFSDKNTCIAAGLGKTVKSQDSEYCIC